MKSLKVISAFVLSLVMCFSLPFSVLAQSTNVSNTEVQYFEDGSYLVTTTEDSISLFSSGSKTHTKTSVFYENDDEKQWSVTLKSSFTYTGSSATCTNASVSYTIYDSAWKVKEANASKSGRTAKGDFLVKKYFLGIITYTLPITLITTCDNNGNIT